MPFFAQEAPPPAAEPGPISINIDLSGLGQSISDALGTWITAFAYGIPQTIVSNMIQHGRQFIIHLVTSDSAANVLIHNPLAWVIGPQTQALHNAMLGGQIAVTMLVLVIGGYRVLFGQTDEWEVILTTGTLVVLSSTMHLWFPGTLQFINERANDVVRLDLPPQFTATGDNLIPSGFEVALMLLYAIWVAFKAALKGLIGVIFLAVLYVIGPFVLIAGAIPFLSGLAQWWTSNVIAWSIRPFLVALVMRFGLGISLTVTDLHIQLLAAIAAFWLADKLPDWLASSSLSAGVWGSIGQMGLVAKAAGALGGAAGMPLAAGAGALRRAFA